jgi:hypothetical protein
VQYQFWTSKEIAVLCRMKRAGETLKNIAFAVGRSETATRGMMDRLRITKRQERITRILLHVTRQHSNIDVANIFGLSLHTLRCYKVALKKLGYRVQRSTEKGGRPLQRA